FSVLPLSLHRNQPSLHQAGRFLRHCCKAPGNIFVLNLPLFILCFLQVPCDQIFLILLIDFFGNHLLCNQDGNLRHLTVDITYCFFFFPFDVNLRVVHHLIRTRVGIVDDCFLLFFGLLFCVVHHRRNFSLCISQSCFILFFETYSFSLALFSIINFCMDQVLSFIHHFFKRFPHKVGKGSEKNQESDQLYQTASNSCRNRIRSS